MNDTTMKLKQPRLSVYLRALCGKAAHERSKATVWAEGKRLRRFAQQRLAEGASEVEVVGWLASEIAAAQLAQANQQRAG